MRRHLGQEGLKRITDIRLDDLYVFSDGDEIPKLEILLFLKSTMEFLNWLLSIIFGQYLVSFGKWIQQFMEAEYITRTLFLPSSSLETSTSMMLPGSEQMIILRKFLKKNYFTKT